MSNIQPIPGVWQLTRLSDFSCHLVEGRDDCTLIDTNFGGSAPAILRLADKLKKPIKRILITHAHMDHVGSLDAVVAALPQVEIYATQRTSEFMAGDRSVKPEDHVQKLRGGFVTTKTRPTHLIKDGDEVAGFRVIATPGHVAGHVSYFNIATRHLFSGDALISVGGTLHVTGVWRLRFPFPYFSTNNKQQALASAQQLLTLQPSWILPVHGPAIANGEQSLNSAIKEAQNAFA